MNRGCVVREVIVSISLFLFFGQSFAGMSLSERWEAEKSVPGSTIQDSTIKAVQDRHFLFIPGIINELTASGYYSVAMETVQSTFGAATSFFGPSSLNSIRMNSKVIRHQVKNLFRAINSGSAEKKYVVLVGHSKGAAEILHLILRQPQLILEGKSKKIDRVILIQPAIQGSPLLSEIKSKFIWSWIYPWLGPGVHSMEQDQAREKLAKSFREFEFYLEAMYGHLGQEAVAEKFKEVSDKVLQVPTYEENEKLSWPIWAAQKACWGLGNLDRYGKNDGLLLTRDMVCPDLSKFENNPKTNSVEGFGVNLGELKTGHIESVVHVETPLIEKVYSGSPDDQSALMRAVVQMAFESI
jgi:hypothetical protein